MLPFAGQSVGKPIRLAGGVAKDLSKTETFEPPRGPRAQVSLVIVAINDHRPVAVERGRRPAVQFFQWDVDRAGQPLFFILSGGQRMTSCAPTAAIVTTSSLLISVGIFIPARNIRQWAVYSG